MELSFSNDVKRVPIAKKKVLMSMPGLSWGRGLR